MSPTHRSVSVPPKAIDDVVSSNPFWSERARQEAMIQASRPAELPKVPSKSEDLERGRSASRVLAASRRESRKKERDEGEEKAMKLPSSWARGSEANRGQEDVKPLSEP